MSAKNAPKWSGLACSLLAVTLALAVLAAGCPKEDDNPAPLPVPPVEPTPPPPPPAAEDAGLELVASGLAHPVALVSPDDGSGRMFIVDQAGTIRIVAQDGTLLPTPFLDLSSSIVPLSAAYDERGLLSMAFHPDYAVNGWFFVHYSAPLRAFGPAGWDHTSTIARFTVSAGDPDAADPGSKVVILEVDQPQANANGGAMVSDSAGCLLVSFGDGGGAGDVGMGHTLPGNGQDLSNFLGSILRLDVDSGLPYTIPADNPFVCFTGIPYEIFAYGFRNPWRMSFDSMNPGTLYVGDAGQNLWEEVDLVSGGMNYGWNLKEGTHYFDPQNPDVSPAMGSDMGAGGEPLKDPIIEYSSGPSGSGTAVIGGYIYNGAFLSTWKGRYVFGDWSRQAGSPD